MDYVVKNFPFRIHTVRTDRGHEWQAKFHWHVEDQGIRHVYIKRKRSSNDVLPGAGSIAYNLASCAIGRVGLRGVLGWAGTKDGVDAAERTGSRS